MSGEWDWLNPFKELSPFHRRAVARQRRVAYEAEQRAKRVQDAYKEILSDQRYQALRDDLSASLGEALRTLVAEAALCGNCAKFAVPVQVMNDIVAEPLHRLFDEAQKSRIEPMPEMANGE